MLTKKWKKVFGRSFPDAVEVTNEAAQESISYSWNDTEQFIEDKYPVDIRHYLKIDCDILQNGFRENSLRNMILKNIPLFPSKKLTFNVTKNIEVPPPYHLKWKVLNRGEVAQRKNQIRGQIVRDEGRQQKIEHTRFRGAHLVECYAVKNGVVVAKSRIDVPIATGE